MPATEQNIRDHAYYLWLQRGRPEGQAMQFWLEAEAFLNGTADVQQGDAAVEKPKRRTTARKKAASTENGADAATAPATKAAATTAKRAVAKKPATAKPATVAKKAPTKKTTASATKTAKTATSEDKS